MELESSAGNERVLIEGIKQGDRSGFDVLVELYKQKGLGIAYNLAGNLEDAKDILQEAFIKVYLNIKNFREEAKFSTWFYRIVVNCALDFLRKRKRMYKMFGEPLRDTEDENQEVADERFQARRVMMRQELAQDLDNCIAELPEKQRICFILKHQNGLTNIEIAQILGCRLSTVKVHLFRAAKTLQDKLSFYLVK